MSRASRLEAGGRGPFKGRRRNLFRTAIQTHYNLGRWEQLEGNKARRPFLMYDAINDGRTRPAHRAMDNHIAPIDDPIWNRWYPPNGFRCRCSVIGLTEAQAKARGYGTKPTPDAQPDKGWDYHPAKGQDGALRKVEVNKLAKAHPKLVMAYPRAVDALRAATPKVSVQGRPNADFVAEMRKAVEDLPEAVKRTLSAGGVEVRVSRTLTGAFPDLKGRRPSPDFSPTIAFGARRGGRAVNGGCPRATIHG
jgi:SPP1 gp7 family putative phage head morphogenesis protein